MSKEKTSVAGFRALATFAMLAAIVGCGGRAAPAPSPLPGNPGSALSPGNHEFEISVDGRSRWYIVHVPRTLQERAPVVIAFHGGTGNPRQFQRTAGLDDVADREGFLAVYPAGTGAGRVLLTWNAGSACCGRAQQLDVDDVEFTRLLLDDLAERVRIDRSRIYGTGHSNGAGMVYRLAAEAPGLLAAIVPVAGASMGIDRSGADPIPILHIHSVDDPRALYAGGTGPPYPGTDRTVDHRAVEDELDFWRQRNECGGPPSVDRERSDDASGQRAELLAWDCPDRALLMHWRLHGSGHSWPGASGRVAERIVGSPSQLLDAAEEVWRFAEANGASR